MAADFRQFDQHGFPIPPRYSDLTYQDQDQPARPRPSLRARRLVILGILLGVVLPIVFGPRLLAMARDLLAQWLATRAQQRLMEGDREGALADFNRAIDWNPNAWALYLQRANLRRELSDLPGSLDDLNSAIDRNPRAWAAFLLRAEVRQKMDKLDESLVDYTEAIGMLDRKHELVRWQAQIRGRSEMLAEAHAGRSWAYVRLGRARDAINDATQAVQLAPSAATLNIRAYARAVLNTELNEGLADIERALASRPDDAAFLDTRGYLLHRLERYAEALPVMDLAITRSEHSDRTNLDQAAQLELDHSLAVMYHHRGEIYEKLGQKDRAEADLRRGENLGYDPARGVF